MEKYDSFEQYIRATEGQPREKSELWQTAIRTLKAEVLLERMGSNKSGHWKSN